MFSNIPFSGSTSQISWNDKKASAINLVCKKSLSFILKVTMASLIDHCSLVKGLEY